MSRTNKPIWSDGGPEGMAIYKEPGALCFNIAHQESVVYFDDVREIRDLLTRWLGDGQTIDR